MFEKDIKGKLSNLEFRMHGNDLNFKYVYIRYIFIGSPFFVCVKLKKKVNEDI